MEPSETMIAERVADSARVVCASAERLPLDDKTFDAAMAVNTVHHWSDLRAGLRELSRIARKRVVVFLPDPQRGTPFWLTRHYFRLVLDPARRFAAIVSAIGEEFPECQEAVRQVAVRLHGRVVHGVLGARPEMYLDANVRRNMSNFALAEEHDVNPGLAALKADLESGARDCAHGHLTLAELDLGHRIFFRRAELRRCWLTPVFKPVNLVPWSLDACCDVGPSGPAAGLSMPVLTAASLRLRQQVNVSTLCGPAHPCRVMLPERSCSVASCCERCYN